jgi:hypothetical protein
MQVDTDNIKVAECTLDRWYLVFFQVLISLLTRLAWPGLIYFVFMIREPFPQSCWPNHRLPVLVLGMFNIVLVLQVDVSPTLTMTRTVPLTNAARSIRKYGQAVMSKS